MNNGILGQWWRLGGILGIAFVVVFIVALTIQGEPPDYKDSIDDIRAFHVEDGQAYLVGDVLFGFASIVLLLPFLVCLRELLARAEGEPHIWSATGFIGGLLLIIVAMTASAAWTTLAFGVDAFSDDQIETIMYLDIGAWHAFPYTTGVFAVANSLVMLRTGVLWKWLGGLGLIVGILAFVSTLWIVWPDSDSLEAMGFFSFIGSALWVLLTGIGMVMRQAEPVGVAVQREM